MPFFKVSLVGAANKAKNFLFNKARDGLTPNQRNLFILAVIAFGIIIALIAIDAMHKDATRSEYYAKRHFAKARHDTQKRIKAIRGSKDPGIQMANIERRRKLQEDIDRENNRTPSRFKLYELLRELFR